MLKKFVSLLSIVALMLGLSAVGVSAADLDKAFVKTLTLSVNGATPDTFNPSKSDVLNVNVVLDSAADLTSSSGSVVIYKGSSAVYTLKSWTAPEAVPSVSALAGLTWDGKTHDNTASSNAVCTVSGSVCPNGAYTVTVHVEKTVGSDKHFGTKDANFSISQPVTLAVKSLTFNKTVIDPAPSSLNDDLVISYELATQADSLIVNVKNSTGVVVKPFFADTAEKKLQGSFTWNGEYNNQLAEPGVYTVQLTATKLGEQDLVSEKTFSVTYASSQRPLLTSVSVSPTSFNPGLTDVIASFTNSVESEITVEVRNNLGVYVKKFTNYSNTSYLANNTHNIAWDGRSDAGNIMPLATYKMVLVSKNAYGVAMESKDVTLTDVGGTISTNNSHIKDITFSPSKFKPSDDQEVRITFDVNMDLDHLTVLAVRGAETIELHSEDNQGKETNSEITWDGTDEDGDYVADGTWKIMFNSKVNSTELVAVRPLTITYDKPLIEELFVSKSKIDNDLGEITYLLFKVSEKANVNVEVLQDGTFDEYLVEDMEVEKDKWYAVEWDGGSYDYSDNVKLNLVAENAVNDKIYSTKSAVVDLAEETTSSTRSNITLDYITPVVTDGNPSMSVVYTLEDDADVSITIHRGKSLSGSKVVELLNSYPQGSGEHTITWNGMDSSGKKLSKGIYTYKIVSKSKSTETESGLFVVGDVGGVEGVASKSNSSTVSTVNKNVNPNVVVDGNVITMNGTINNSSNGKCASFKDVSETSAYCESITWAVDNGVLNGYSDGTFKPFQAINRAETLKVVMLASNVPTFGNAYVDLGFTDVKQGEWYVPYMAAAKTLGVFSGDAGKKTARPSDTVNRAEALKLVFESLRSKTGYQIAGCASSYYDVAGGSWYQNFACESSKYKLFAGLSLLPSQSSTRAEVVDMLFKLSEAGVL